MKPHGNINGAHHATNKTNREWESLQGGEETNVKKIKKSNYYFLKLRN